MQNAVAHPAGAYLRGGVLKEARYCLGVMRHSCRNIREKYEKSL